MSVLESDIIVYGSANMAESDSGTQGGAIATAKRIAFEDLAANGQVQAVSSAAGDTSQTVTVTGRDAAGVIQADAITLNGTTAAQAGSPTTFERLLKGVKSASTTGDVAVEAATATRTGTAQAGAAASASAMATITLDASASATDDAYKGQVLRITSGTGAGQIRRIVRYTGATKVAAVSRDWATPPDNTSVFRVSVGMVFEKTPAEVTEVRRPFYGAAADAPGGSARDYYEKVFVKNTHATLALTNAVIKEQADPSAKIAFGLEGSLDGTGTSTDRRTAPGGITFDSADKNVANSQNHTAGAAQGVWMKLSLAAGDAAQKTSYTLRETGSTT